MTDRDFSILELVEKKGIAAVAELARELRVSEITIRRQLNTLAEAGYINRVHGGAVSVHGRSVSTPFYLRIRQNKAAKEAIGRYAASLISDGDSVALDLGTTSLEIAKNLVDRRNLTVVTANLHIALALLNIPHIRTILPGGAVRSVEGALAGETAMETLRRYYVDRFFLAVGGIDSRVGLTEQNLEDADLKQVLIRNAKECILVADSSKFEQVGFAFVGGLDSIKQLITDRLPLEPLLDSLKRANVEIHIVPGADREVGLEEKAENRDQRSARRKTAMT